MPHTTTKFIKQRRSVRSFTSEPVAEAVITDILDCGRLAPTARNVQPWLLGAVTDQELRHRISDVAEYGSFIRESPVCFAVFALGDEKYYLEDGCAATMNIILAASAHGLSTCWVAGDKKDYGPVIGDLVHVPSRYKLVSLIACGYTEEKPAPHKKSLEEVCFWNRYGD
ncbi:MAG: nitroreductase family protein [Pseudomonadota bacterium]|jgi:nitroreductase